MKTQIGEAFPLDLTQGSLMELIEMLNIPPKQTRIIYVNGKRITDLKHQLKGGDLVVIFPPVGGGGVNS